MPYIFGAVSAECFPVTIPLVDSSTFIWREYVVLVGQGDFVIEPGGRSLVTVSVIGRERDNHLRAASLQHPLVVGAAHESISGENAPVAAVRGRRRCER